MYSRRLVLNFSYLWLTYGPLKIILESILATLCQGHYTYTSQMHELFSTSHCLLLFLPVDRKDLCALLWLTNKDSFVSNSDLHPSPPWSPEKERTKGRPRGRLNSDDQVSKQKTPNTSVSEHRNWMLWRCVTES